MNKDCALNYGWFPLVLAQDSSPSFIPQMTIRAAGQKEEREAELACSTRLPTPWLSCGLGVRACLLASQHLPTPPAPRWGCDRHARAQHVRWTAPGDTWTHVAKAGKWYPSSPTKAYIRRSPRVLGLHPRQAST